MAIPRSAAHGERLEEFGSRIRGFRKSRGLTQEQLAREAGVDRKTINRIENSRYSPTLANVYSIADALKVEIRELL